MLPLKIFKKRCNLEYYFFALEIEQINDKAGCIFFNLRLKLLILMKN